MALRSFVPQPISGKQISSNEFSLFQNLLDLVLRQFTMRAQNDDYILTSVALLAAGTTLVEHRLGRTWQGWRIVDQTANSVVWRDTTSTADPSRFLPLACSANCTVTLEVY